MSKRGKKGRGRSGAEGAAGGESHVRREPPIEGGPRRGFRAWYDANRSDIRFLVVFSACLIVYYLATLTPPVKDGFFPAYLKANAVASGAILRAVGQPVEVQGNSLVSAAGSSIQIERGCDAVEPSALFVAAVLASPVRLGSRLLAAALGTLVLMVLNLVRVISLFWVRVHYPSAFETMHLDVWQALFIILALVLWAAWASRAVRRSRSAVSDATS